MLAFYKKLELLRLDDKLIFTVMYDAQLNDIL